MRWAEWAEASLQHYQDEGNAAKNKMVRYRELCMDNLLLVQQTTTNGKTVFRERARWAVVEAMYAGYAASRVVWVLWASTCALWCAAGGWSGRSRGSVRQGWAAERRARTRTGKGKLIRTRKDQWTHCGSPPSVTTAGTARLCDLLSSCIRFGSHCFGSNRKFNDFSRMFYDIFIFVRFKSRFWPCAGRSAER